MFSGKIHRDTLLRDLAFCCQNDTSLFATKRRCFGRKRHFESPQNGVRAATPRTSQANPTDFGCEERGVPAAATRVFRLENRPKPPPECSVFPIKEGRKRTREMQASEPQNVTQKSRECVLFSLGTAWALSRHSRAVGRKQDVSRNGRNRSKVSTALCRRKMEGSEIWG